MQSQWGTIAARLVSFLRGCWEDGADRGSKVVVVSAAVVAQRHKTAVKQVTLLSGLRCVSLTVNIQLF